MNAVAEEKNGSKGNSQAKWGTAVLVFDIVYAIASCGMFFYVLTVILPQMTK